jgi:hypothetical protein
VGAAAERIAESRQLTAEQIRTIEEFKDRTGSHIVVGSAADP